MTSLLSATKVKRKPITNLGSRLRKLQVKGDKFSNGFEFGLGICVNDGDKAAGQNGQKGWSGWYTHSVVHGKNSEKTGLVVLTNETLAVEAANKLTTTWGKLKSAQ